MSSLCGTPTIQQTTITALNTPYIGIPNGTPTIVQAMRDAGIASTTTALSDANLATILSKLGRSYYPPPPTSTATDSDISGFMAADAKFVNNVKAEYCWYFSRYANGINQLLDSVINPNNTDTGGNTFSTLNDACKTLNNHLNDIVRFVQAVAKKRKSSLSGITENLNSLNNNLTEASTSLTKQQAILSKQQTTVQLYKEMEEFSREKSKHTNNLLMLYSFLNITALGLLFYIYRSAGN